LPSVTPGPPGKIFCGCTISSCEKTPSAARGALEAIEKSIAVLRDFPFTCRKATPDDPFLRELVIPFGGGGYVALFEIEDDKTVTVLAVRHQREDDYR